MSLSVPIDTRELTITPVFKHVTVEDVPASEREGKAIMKTVEVVEVRFAGSKNYSPVFPTDAFWRRDGHRVITYAERWAEQYKAFLDGSVQQASGTPLEMLKPYGISDAQLSVCRALKVYSIEALHHLEGPSANSLGMNRNALKKMAADYMADRTRGSDTAAQIEALKAEIAALRATQSLPAVEPKPAEVEAAIAAADAEFEAMSDEQLKDFIGAKAGARPRGQPSRSTLVNMAREAAAA